MKAVQITRHGGPEVFRLVDLPSPKLTRDGVRIQIKAAGVNFADIMMRMGLYPHAPKIPFTPGYEVAGVVTEVGPEAQGFRIGDRVVAMTMFGGYATEAVVPARQVRPIPSGMTEVEAAAIPVNFMTAWIALEEMARVRKGDRVLIQSAAGGVGTAAVQIAANAGAHVVGLVGSEAKFAAVKALGAAEMLTRAQWEKAKDSDFEPFDTILECEGGASLKRCFRRLAPGGRMITYGVADLVTGPKRSFVRSLPKFLATPFYHPLQLMNANKGVFGINVLLFGSVSKGQTILKGFEKILDRFENHRLKVVVGKTFPLENVAAAHTYFQSRANIGKIILTHP